MHHPVHGPFDRRTPMSTAYELIIQFPDKPSRDEFEKALTSKNVLVLLPEFDYKNMVRATAIRKDR